MYSGKIILTLFNLIVLAGPLLSAPTETSTDEEIATATTTKPTTTEPTTQFETTTTAVETTSNRRTSTFSCEKRVTGYYADVKLGCRVYHFCATIEELGEVAYQRVSYMCLEGSIFDQKELNCVREIDLNIPCNKAESYYDSSNKQFDSHEEAPPSMSDNLAANIMMNPLTRFIAG